MVSILPARVVVSCHVMNLDDALQRVGPSGRPEILATRNRKQTSPNSNTELHSQFDLLRQSITMGFFETEITDDSAT
jgi:hypothetical protein